MSDDKPEIYTEYIDIRLVSEANQREHWAIKARRVKEHRKAAYYACKKLGGPEIILPCTVLLLRIFGPMRRAYDSDNLQSAFKAVRDGIAGALGVNDNNPGINWEYAQRKGLKDCVGISIRKQQPTGD